MKTRCNNPNYEAFERYGGRGIRVCERWNASFAAFLGDMGPKPDGLTIERVDNDGNYTPDNCEWATRIAQARNRRSTLYATVNGETLCAKDWIARLDISPNAFYTRARRIGCQAAVEHYQAKPKWAHSPSPNEKGIDPGSRSL